MSMGCAYWVTAPDDKRVAILHENVLKLHTDLQTDVVFSVGLIKHFSPIDTGARSWPILTCSVRENTLFNSFPALSPYATSGRNARVIEISGRRKRLVACANRATWFTERCLGH